MRLALVFLLGCGAASPAPEPEPEEDTALVPVAVGLRLTEAPTDESTGTPHTRVVLVMIHPDHGRETHPVGNLPGACVPEIPGDGEQLQQVRCWWAGQGSELSLAQDGRRLVVTQVTNPEDGTTASPPAQLLSIDIPEGRQVIAIGTE
ncbi:MAG: hypothetical protein AAGF12_30685 [Myxococcota bacterium]